MSVMGMAALALSLGMVSSTQPAAMAARFDRTDERTAIVSPLRFEGAEVVAARKRRSMRVEPASAPAAQRFDMTQGGKRMTADDFDAWMKARGIRVATGKPRDADSADAPTAAVSRRGR